MKADDLPWLEPLRASLRAAVQARRISHAYLVSEAPGTGGEELAQWFAALLVCRAGTGAAQPCGQCLDCRRVLAAQHPDCIVVQPVEDSKQIRIEQIRALAEDLSLTGHGGGYKLGLIVPADAMNKQAANAFLKTLEEPSPNCVLILVTSYPSRLPATVLSRCQRIHISAPSRETIRAWLNARRGGVDWDAVLDIVGDSPLAAAQADAAAIAAVCSEVRSALQGGLPGVADPAAAADRWARDDYVLRLRCIETWITERIREAAAVSGRVSELRPSTHLSSAGQVMNIRGLFGLLDDVREMRAWIDVPLNKALGLERLLWRLRSLAA